MIQVNFICSLICFFIYFVVVNLKEHVDTIMCIVMSLCIKLVYDYIKFWLENWWRFLMMNWQF